MIKLMVLSLHGIGEFKIIFATSQIPGLNLGFLSHSKFNGGEFYFISSIKKKIERFSGFLKMLFLRFKNSSTFYCFH